MVEGLWCKVADLIFGGWPTSAGGRLTRVRAYRHQGCFGRLEAADHLLPRDSANLPSFVTLRFALAGFLLNFTLLSLTFTLSSHLLPRFPLINFHILPSLIYLVKPAKHA